jgi:hypothetical protein
LKQDAVGVLRGRTGYRPELEALARTLKIMPEELPPTTSQEFFLRKNMSVLRLLVKLPSLPDPITPRLCRGPEDDDHTIKALFRNGPNLITSQPDGSYRPKWKGT